VIGPELAASRRGQATDSGSDCSVSVKAVSSDVILSSAFSVGSRSSYWKHP
jgi:hypothetical protein